jgi:hypothetical protein
MTTTLKSTPKEDCTSKGDYDTFGFKKPDNISWEILRALSITKAKIQGNAEFYLTPEKMFSKDAFTRSKDKKKSIPNI